MKSKITSRRNSEEPLFRSHSQWEIKSLGQKDRKSRKMPPRLGREEEYLRRCVKKRSLIIHKIKVGDSRYSQRKTRMCSRETTMMRMIMVSKSVK